MQGLNSTITSLTHKDIQLIFYDSSESFVREGLRKLGYSKYGKFEEK
ncbi:hypothetical protein JXZ92_03230 [Mycoplasma sp. CSL10137]|nr:hypothetical protein [Mycoplasma sp. CSL10137]MBN4083813.1 hypothetical protein [Mycoplasma sp. CSL10137]